MLWLSYLAEVILFLESGHTPGRERERERERGGGVRDWTELTAGVNFAFSSMPNDLHAEERQARLERTWVEVQVRGEYGKAHRSVPTSCLDPLDSKLGFSHMSIFSQSAERAARAAPNGVKKGATFLLVFRSLNHTASSRKAFNGVQKGPSSLKETQTKGALLLRYSSRCGTPGHGTLLGKAAVKKPWTPNAALTTKRSMRFGSSTWEWPGVFFLCRSKRSGLLRTKENDEGVAALLARVEGRSLTEGRQLMLSFFGWIRGLLLQSACGRCQ